MRRSNGLYLVPMLILIGMQTSTAVTDDYADILFDSHSILELTIETDLKVLINDIAYQRDYHRAVISYLNDNGFDDLIPLKIKTRGNFRRGRDNCNFPPMLLNFPKKWTYNTLFHGRDKLKLVTHCVTEDQAYQNYILKEFLVYKLLNQLTDFSFKARLVKVTYLDSEDDMESLIRYGFLIEDQRSLAKRIDGSSAKVILTSRENPDYYLSTLMSLFQFMIGNTDWYLPNHNMQPFALEDEQDTIAIPYDFDLTGFVNPHYTNQYKNYQLASPRDRYYLGFCRTEAEINPVIDLFRDQKEDVIKVVQEFEYLDLASREDCIEYLEEFYRLIQTESEIMEKITATCNDEF